MTTFIQQIASLPAQESQAFIEHLSEQELYALMYDWQYWARPEQITPPGEWNVWLFLAGRGCIAAGTLIYNPVTDTHTPVEVLERSGKPVIVLAMTEKGPQPVQATAPFVRGIAPLYKVTLEGGRTITTTSFHRFLTPQGWKTLSSLATDALIGCAHDLQASNAAPSLLASLVDGWSCSQTTLGYQDGYLTYHHYDGVQLRGAGDNVPTFPPSQDGVDTHTHSCGHRDDQHILLGCNRHHHMLDSRPSKSSCAQGEPLLLDEECRVLSCGYAHTPQKRRALPQSHALTFGDWHTHVSSLHQGEWAGHPSPIPLRDVSCVCQQTLTVAGLSEEKHQPVSRCQQWITPTHRENQSNQWEPLSPGVSERQMTKAVVLSSAEKHHIAPRFSETTTPVDIALEWQIMADDDILSYSDYISWQRITSIDFVEFGAFYDLTVPGPANYLANGIWNHNCGKTRTDAEDFKKYGLEHKNSRMAIIAPTYQDARDTCVEGESGLLHVLPPDKVAVWNRSLGELILTNGTRYKLFSAEEPDRLRGPQHHRIWCEELCAWKYLQLAWDNAMLGLRLGKRPRAIISTTPKPSKFLRELIKRPDVHVTRGTTFDNEANLAPAALEQLKRRYANTRTGRQELFAEILEDAQGALWKREAMIEQYRVTEYPDLIRIVVAVDPAVADPSTKNQSEEVADENAETGIVVAGIAANGHGYVLDDMSLQASPLTWASEAVTAYRKYKADRIVGEKNNGGALVESNIRTVDKNVSYSAVWASRGKYTRAEPVASFYEQGKVHHVGMFSLLEDQMAQWEPLTGQKSPDRLDALVWCLTELMGGNALSAAEQVEAVKRRVALAQSRSAQTVPVGGVTGWQG